MRHLCKGHVRACTISRTSEFAQLTWPDASARLEAEPTQLLRVSLPVLGHPYVQVKIDALAQQFLDRAAGIAAHLTQPTTPGADHDALLTGSFHVHVGVDAGDRALLVGLV